MEKKDNNWIVENLFVDGNNYSSVQHYLFALRFNNIKEIFNKFLKDNPHPLVILRLLKNYMIQF